VSIFTKDCPVCAASHAVHVVRCGCGYCFDPNKLDGVTQELEVISQEEQLYREYLAARADQAEKARQATRADAAREPGNNVKTAEALRAEQIAMSARAELSAQDERARAVKNRIKVVRSNRRAKKVKAAAAAHTRPISVREVVAPKPTPVLVSPPPVLTQAPPPAVTPPKLTVIAETKPPAAAVVKPATPKPTPIAIAKKETPRPVVAAPVPKPAMPPKPVAIGKPVPVRAAAPTVVAKPVQRAVPNEVSALAALTTPLVLDKPTPSFRASQANKAEQVKVAPAQPATSQDCPNCYGKVAPNAKRCRCGFEMPLAASQIPSLSLSAEDRAAFLAALAPLGSDSSS
jgi:hypothetical protein